MYLNSFRSLILFN